MSGLWRDIKFSVRLFMKEPWILCFVILTLALGIGVNTAIFGVVQSLFLRPMTETEPERLLSIVPVTQKPGQERYISYPDYRDFSTGTNDVFTDVVAISEFPRALSVRFGDFTERVWGSFITANYLSCLGVKPLLGRTFLPEEDQAPGSYPVVMISERLWRARFGSMPDIVGRTIALNQERHTIVGVVRERDALFRRVLRTDLFLPTALYEKHSARGAESQAFVNRQHPWLSVFARLKPGVGKELAQGKSDAVAALLQQTYPESSFGAGGTDNGVRLVAAHDRWNLPSFLPREKSPIFFSALFGMSGLVLLLACTNIANLLLARAATRLREFAVRQSLGASRWQVIRQQLIENAIIAFASGTFAIVLILFAVQAVKEYSPSVQLIPFLPPLTLEIAVDWTVIGFALGASGASVLLFSIFPFLWNAQTNLVYALKSNGQKTSERQYLYSARQILIIAQVMFSFVVLAGSGLFLRGLQSAWNTDLGFDERRVAMVTVSFWGQEEITDDGIEAYVRRARERLASVPGVEEVSFSTERPMSGASWVLSGNSVRIEGYSLSDEGTVRFNANSVGPRYFETLRIPILQGHGFDDRDWDQNGLAVVVDESFVSRYLPGQNAIGKRIRVGEKDWRIIGVVQACKFGSFTEDPAPMCYVMPPNGWPPLAIDFWVRTATTPDAFLEVLRREITVLDPNVPIIEVKTLEQQLGDSLFASYVVTWLSSFFGALALCLVSLGLYGLLTYYVTCQTREMGIRVALGAQYRDVILTVLNQGIRLVSVGSGLGLIASLLCSQVIRGLLFGVSPADPVTFVVISVLVAGVSFFACWIPARKAAKVDPMKALRYE